MSSTQEEKIRQTEKRTFHIIVNTREREVHQQVLTFDEITKLAYPNPDGITDPIFTVSFKNADQKPSAGTLVEGESVKIKNGTIFNVKRTNRS
ncbi:MAG: multiubiquitin domain-containing protein [Candidatus Sulfotelmatobacter sp.]